MSICLYHYVCEDEIPQECLSRFNTQIKTQPHLDLSVSSLSQRLGRFQVMKSKEFFFTLNFLILSSSLHSLLCGHHSQKALFEGKTPALLYSASEKSSLTPGPSLSASPPASTAVDKTSGRQDLFRQSSPGTHADTETVIRQALGRSRGSEEAEALVAGARAWDRKEEGKR